MQQQKQVKEKKPFQFFQKLDFQNKSHIPSSPNLSKQASIDDFSSVKSFSDSIKTKKSNKIESSHPPPQAKKQVNFQNDVFVDVDNQKYQSIKHYGSMGGMKNMSNFFDDFLEKSSLSKGSNQINFSGFKSVNVSNQSKVESVNQNSNEDIRRSQVNKKIDKEQKLKSSNSKGKKEINLSDFIDKSIGNSINFSGFETVKSNISKQSSAKIDTPRPTSEISKQLSKSQPIESNPALDPPNRKSQEINFSKFDSVNFDKSIAQSMFRKSDENKISYYQDVIKTHKDDILDQSNEKKKSVGLSMFGSVQSKDGQISIDSKIKMKKDNSNLFGQFQMQNIFKKSSNQQAVGLSAFDSFISKNSQTSSVQSCAVNQKIHQNQENQSKFRQQKSEPKNKVEIPLGYIHEQEKKIQEPIESIEVSKTKNQQNKIGFESKPQEDNIKNSKINNVKFNLFTYRDSVQSMGSQQYKQMEYQLAKLSEEPQKPTIQKNSGIKSINFDAFDSLKSNLSNKQSIKSNTEKAVTLNKSNLVIKSQTINQQTSRSGQINFSMFASARIDQIGVYTENNADKQENISENNKRIQESTSKNVIDQKHNMQNDEIGLSGFCPVKSNHSIEKSVNEEIEKFKNNSNFFNDPKQQDSYHQNEQKQSIGFSMFASVKSNSEHKQSFFESQPRNSAQKTLDFDNFFNKVSSIKSIEQKQSLEKSKTEQHQSRLSENSVRVQKIENKKPIQIQENIIKTDKIQKVDPNQNENFMVTIENKESIGFSEFDEVQSNLSHKQSMNQSQIYSLPIKKESIEQPLEAKRQESQSVKSNNFNNQDKQNIEAKQSIGLSMFAQMVQRKSDIQSVNIENQVYQINEKQAEQNEKCSSVNLSLSRTQKNLYKESHKHLDRFGDQSINLQQFMQKTSSLIKNPNIEQPQIFAEQSHHSSSRNHNNSTNSQKKSHQNAIQQVEKLSVTSKKQQKGQINSSFPSDDLNHQIHQNSSKKTSKQIKQQQFYSIKTFQQPSLVQRIKSQKLSSKNNQSMQKLKNTHQSLQLKIQQLKSKTQNSEKHLSYEKQTLTIFKKQLDTLKDSMKNIISDVNFEKTLLSSSSSLSNLFQSYQYQRMSENDLQNKIFEKIQRLYDFIDAQAQIIKLKLQQERRDPFRNVFSPFKLKEIQEQQTLKTPINQQDPFRSNETHKFKKYILDLKVKLNQSYKKLFSPKDNIFYRSSYFGIKINYVFEITQGSNILAISLSISNSSAIKLHDVRLEIQKVTRNIIEIKPQQLYMPELKPNESIFQMISMLNFDKDNYFIPLKITYTPQKHSRRELKLPISIDITKFLYPIKPRPKQQYHNLTHSTNMKIKQKTELSMKNAILKDEHLLKGKIDDEGYFTVMLYQDKMSRLTSLSGFECVEIYENFGKQGNQIQILSNSTQYLSLVEEYILFMYDY